MTLTIPATIRVLLPDGTVERIPLEDYVRGVVAAVLPADTPLEALKAQAVAARTFAAHTHRHLDRAADVCTVRHCQHWRERANPTAARAVIETRGIVALHQGKLIDAFYFDHCDGHTRDGTTMIAGAPAYLKSVACACGFATLKGHGIGMCQRGVSVMARFGDSYDVILRHYYTGIVLEFAESQAAPGETHTHKRRLPAAHAQASPKSPRSSATPNAIKTKPSPTSPKSSPTRRAAPRVQSETAAIESTIAESPTPAQVESTSPSTPVEIQAPVEPAPPKILAAIPLAALAKQSSAKKEKTKPPAKEPASDEQTPASATAAPITATLPQAQASAAPLDSPIAPVEEAAPESPPVNVSQTNSFYPPVYRIAPLFESRDVPPASGAAPPPSMPEEMPGLMELDFVAPPAVEEPPPTVVNAAPLVERFFVPLDAPPTMPEALPNFNNESRTDETPILWIAPPPIIEESDIAADGEQLLIDYLPGPRVIAGNLAKAGMIVTIRDLDGNAVITVSGMAKHYGSGGFEAPLSDEGSYSVSFDHTKVDVKLEDETVFIYYG